MHPFYANRRMALLLQDRGTASIACVCAAPNAGNAIVDIGPGPAKSEPHPRDKGDPACGTV